jgi:hypothetical protein
MGETPAHPPRPFRRPTEFRRKASDSGKYPAQKIAPVTNFQPNPRYRITLNRFFVA